MISAPWVAASVAHAQVCSINIGPDHTICQGQTVTLQGPAGFSNYLWSTGSTTQNITVGAPANYWCQVSYPSGELVTNGNFSAGNTGFSTQFILNSNLNLGDGHYWIGTNAASHHPQFIGTGTGQFMIVNSGWASAQFMVWCQDVTVCPGQTYTLSYRARTVSNATPARLQWWINGSASGPEVNLPAFGTGWQTITHTWTSPPGLTTATICLRAMSGEGVGNDFGLDDISMSGTIVLTDDALVSVIPLPNFDLGPDATLCTGQSLMLDAFVPGGSYLWQDGSTNSNHVVNGPGLYSVTVTANGCSATDNITVNYNPMPTVDLGPDTVLCAGQTLTLDATYPGATHVWQDGSTAPTFTVTAPGLYSVGVNLNGCVASDFVDVTYNPLPSVNLGPDQNICAGQQATFDATTPGATYLWSTGATTPTIAAGSPGNYAVSVTVNGCSASDDANLNVTPLPPVDLGPDQTICPGTSITLNAAVPGGSYLWSTGATSPSIVVGNADNYWVQVTANGCSATDAVNIALHTLPVVNLGPDIAICQGSTTTLAVNVPGATYLWNTGATGNAINVGSAGIHWVDATLNGCTVRDSIVVSVTPLPVVNLGPDQGVCPGGTALLNATTPGATYLWSSGQTTPTINTGPGNYSVQVTVNGCTGSDAIDVFSHPAPSVSLGNDTTLCPGAQWTPNVAQPGASYLWNTGATSATITVSAPGTYSVTLTDANGCTASDAVQVNYAPPIPLELGPDITLCPGDQVVLNAAVPGGSYLWNTGAVAPSITVSTAGNYSVTATVGNCAASDAVNVQVIPVPVIDLGPDATLCPGETVLLNATLPGASYQWNTGATTATITVSAPGTYSVIATLPSGCSASDAITIAYATPSAVDLGPDQTLCAGQPVVLDAALPGATYLWSTGATTQTIAPTSSGTYWVQVTQGACAAADTVSLIFNPVPTVNLGPDQTICLGSTTTLNAAWPGATYLWSTGATTASISVAAAGTYSVQVSLNGCTGSDAVDVAVFTPTPFDLGPGQSACAGDVLTLDASVPNGTYLWNTGATSPTLPVTGSGTYTVTVTQGPCSSTDAVTITFNDPGNIELGPDLSICAGNTVVLDASLSGATYAWNTGATTPTITVGTSGTYSVTATVGTCSVSDQVTVTVVPLPTVDIGPDVALCTGDAATFSALQPGASYLWSNGSTQSSITVADAGTVSVVVTVAGCSASDEAEVVLLPTPVVDLGADQTLCEGDALVLDVSQPGATYLWDDGSTSGSRTITDAGTYWVTVDLAGCSGSDTTVVAVFSPSALDLGADVSLCPGQSVILDATLPGATYLWSTGATTPAITVSQAGNYGVQVQVGACSAADAVTVNVVQLPQPDLGPDTTVCQGESVTLSVLPGNASVLWSTGGTGPSIAVLTGGTYTVTLSLQGCTASDAVVVTVLPFIDTIDLGMDRLLCPGSTVVLDAAVAGGTAYLWSTGATTPLIVVQEPGTYTVQAMGPCMDATGSITITPGDCGPMIHAPNAFTPNGDGINDIFLPVVSGELVQYRLEIFDRWGEAIHATENPALGWDGRAAGADVQDGVYIWVVEYRAVTDLGVKGERLTGHVTLLR